MTGGNSEVGKVVGRFPPKSSEVCRLFAGVLERIFLVLATSAGLFQQSAEELNFCGGFSFSEVNWGAPLATAPKRKIAKASKERIRASVHVRARTGAGGKRNLNGRQALENCIV